MKMKTKDRIYKLYNKIINSHFNKFDIGIQVYSTIYNLLKSYANSTATEKSYKQLIIYYNHYLEDIKKGKKEKYINSKYNPEYAKSNNAKQLAFKIVALAGEPIFFVAKAFKRKPDSTIVFYILHELGHVKMKTLNEHKCDLFAIRWIRKLIKEGIIEGVKK